MDHELNLLKFVRRDFVEKQLGDIALLEETYSVASHHARDLSPLTQYDMIRCDRDALVSITRCAKSSPTDKVK